MSPASVSRQLAALEAELGSALLARTTRRLGVTDLGRWYYHRCVAILHDVEAAQSMVRARAQDHWRRRRPAR
jgi:DNA-binding transcriptional LysR family regulator